MPDVYQMLLILLTAALATLKVTLQSGMSRRYIRTSTDSLRFNIMMFFAIAVMFIAFFPLGQMDSLTLLCGLAMGLMTTVAQTCYAVALRRGPVSLTVLIASFNVLLPTVFSTVAFREPLYLTQAAGILCLVISLVLNCAPEPAGQAKASGRWMALSLLVLLFMGGSSVIQKVFLNTPSASIPDRSNTLMVVTYLSAAAFSTVVHLVMGRMGRRETSPLRFRPGIMLNALAIGAVLCFYQKSHLYAIAKLNGAFYFPTSAGMQMLLATLLGVTLFRDHLTRRQVVGMGFGILCVALMNLKAGPVL